jgi:hypothetical protein
MRGLWPTYQAGVDSKWRFSQSLGLPNGVPLAAASRPRESLSINKF